MRNIREEAVLLLLQTPEKFRPAVLRALQKTVPLSTFDLMAMEKIVSLVVQDAMKSADVCSANSRSSGYI